MMDEGELEKTEAGTRSERGREREGETEVPRGDRARELDSMFERNMATRVSERLETSAICKNNLSNYEERLLASPSDMFYCNPISFTRSLLVDPSAVYIQLYRCSCILLLIM